MSKRFSGKYSPDQVDHTIPRGTYEQASVDPVGARANVLFVPAIPLVATSLNDGAISLSFALAGAASLTLAAWFLRDGLRAEAAFNARKVARRPALPRKIIATVLTGIGAALAVVAHQNVYGLLAPVLFGIIASGLHTVAFGTDPMRDKGMEGIDTFQQDRVARVVDKAEVHLKAMTDALRRAGDREMQTRLERFQTTARDLIRTVEEDPRDLSAARKYLGVYLQGARDATAKFADVYARTKDTQARADYATLLDDLDQNFSARTRKLLLEDRSDLTVEIDVLRERLQREGVRLTDPE